MEQSEIFEHRYRFFAEKGIILAAQYDKTLASLFTGIIAGLVAIVAYQRVGRWCGAFFVAADFMAVVGLGHCLFHMSLSSKLMNLYAAFFGGHEHVPSLVLGEESAEAAIVRVKAEAQLCYSGQLVCLLLSVLSAGLGLAAMLWDQVKMIGLILAASLGAFLLLAVFLRVFWARRSATRPTDGTS